MENNLKSRESASELTPEQLWDDVVKARLAREDLAREHMTKEDRITDGERAEREHLTHKEMDALAKYVTATGTALPPKRETDQWVSDGLTAAAAMQDIASQNPNDPDAAANADHYARLAEYREAAVETYTPKPHN